MVRRRAFVSGMLAAGLLPRPSWADAGRPAVLSAARSSEGKHVLCGVRPNGQIAFTCPLPARGHAAAAHPERPEAVAFARRPGTFALVLDCRTGETRARIAAPPGTHFYGHGTFCAEGSRLYTTENEIETGRGLVGVWDATAGYRRIGAFASGGIGPHDIKLLPGGTGLVIANGGIETHPETGRAKLNIPTMRAALSYVSLDGRPLHAVTLAEAHQKNSIRHLAVAGDGTVAFAMQWQGDVAADLPLLGLHNRTKDRLDLVAQTSIRALDGYLGSVALSPNGRQVAVTAPRRGRLDIFEDTSPVARLQEPDICGVAGTPDGFIATTGAGWILLPSGRRVLHPLAWDNHLVALEAGQA